MEAFPAELLKADGLGHVCGAGTVKASTFVWVRLAGQRFCGAASTGLLDRVHAFCQRPGRSPPVDRGSVLHVHIHQEVIQAIKQSGWT